MSANAPDARLYGYLVEFEDVDSIVTAARRVRDEGYRLWDCHTPFPVHGMDAAMGLTDSKLGIMVFIIICLFNSIYLIVLLL